MNRITETPPRGYDSPFTFSVFALADGTRWIYSIVRGRWECRGRTDAETAQADRLSSDSWTRLFRDKFMRHPGAAR